MNIDDGTWEIVKFIQIYSLQAIKSKLYVWTMKFLLSILSVLFASHIHMVWHNNLLHCLYIMKLIILILNFILSYNWNFKFPYLTF